MDTAGSDDLLRAGRRALAAADWDRARALFTAAGELGETPEVLDGLSQADHFQGRYASAITLKEQAFAAYRARGDPVAAAGVARRLGFLNGTVNGDFAIAAGWMARAERILDEVDECAAHGWLTLDQAPLTSDPSQRERLAQAAIAIARRHGDIDLEFGARALLGQVWVARGRVAEGMRLLDEAMAAISGGEVADAAAIADIYCRLLSACEHAADVRRAEEWIAAADRLVAAAWSDFVAPSCRCHYGGILIARGRWTEAEEQLLSALGAFEDGYRAERASPLVRLAALRVLQGRLEEAEQMLGGLDWHPAARASLAAIALARGDHEVAEDLARRCVEGEDPSSPACGALLELLAAAQLARDDEEGARSTIARLAVLASGCGSERVAAMAGLAEGRLLAVRGDPAGASLLARAVEGFSALGLPVEEGRARLALAQALASRSPAAARAEARLAMSLLEDLGARRDADAAAGLLRMLGDPGRSRAHAAGPLTGREAEVLSLLAAGLSNAAIAKRLVISRRTAEHHVASILGKLGVRTRAEAIARALREGPPDT